MKVRVTDMAERGVGVGEREEEGVLRRFAFMKR
jgi:hypothetical protein